MRIKTQVSKKNTKQYFEKDEEKNNGNKNTNMKWQCKHNKIVLIIKQTQ